MLTQFNDNDLVIVNFSKCRAYQEVTDLIFTIFSSHLNKSMFFYVVFAYETVGNSVFSFTI